MSAKHRQDDDETGFSTLDFIAEARRPLLVERHRKLIEEMESGLSDSYIVGDVDHPRLQSMLQQLEVESEQTRIGKTMRLLADDPHFKDSTLRAALVEQLCLLREEGNVEVAALQLHVIGVYRAVRQSIIARQGEAPSLSDLREVPATMLARLFNAIPPAFGSPNLAESLVYTPAFADRSMRTIRRIRRAEGADTSWQDANGEPFIPREIEEPLANLPELERKAARQLLVCDRIRSNFYREVFLHYLDRNEFDVQAEAHTTVLHWLEAIEATAHLYPFLQGQTAGQKSWRLGQLAQKILQLHEIYARVAMATQHPTYRASFEGKNTRERLAIMSKDHYPPLALSPELTLAALICPFGMFVSWVQEQVGKHDFVLPPDPKR